MKLREIKFRIWDTEFGSMLYPDSLIWFGDESCRKNGDMGYVLLQYTGLKDKNGHDIYEGDFVIIEDCSFDEGAMVGEVKQNEYGTWLVEGIGVCKLYDVAHQSSIFANIYQSRG